MLHRSVTLAYAVCAVLGSILALTAFHAFDEYQMIDADHQVRVDESTAGGSAAQAHRLVVETAARTGADIARFVDDVRAPDSVAHLYGVSGSGDGPLAERLADGYTGFSRYTDVRFHPYEEIGELDPRGYYLVWGDRSDAQALLDGLEELGMGGAVASMPGLADLPPHVADTPLGLAALVTLLAVMVLVGSGVVMGAPAYGVLRLQGRSYPQIVLRDLREVARVVALVTLSVAVVAVVGLGIYNGFARFGTFVVVALATVGVLLAATVTTHALAVAMVSRSPILAAVKGEFPSRAAMVAMYLVRVPAVALVAAVGFSCVQAYLVVEQRAAAQAAWTAAADTSTVLVSGTAGASGDPEVFSRIGSMAREAVDDGAALVVADVTAAMVPGDPRGPDLTPDVSCPVLHLSPSYLAEHEVLAPDGAAYGAEVAADAPVLLLPPACGDDVRTGASDLLGAWAAMGGAATPELVEREPAAGQDHFTYGDQWDPDVSPWVTGAALLVVPAHLPVVSDATYGELVSSGDVLFADQEDALARAEEAGVRDHVAGVLRAGTAAAKQTRQVALELRTSVVSFVGVLGVVVMTAVGVVAIHSRRHAQEIYVRHIAGWRFWRAARGVLGVEAALAVLTVVWSLDRAATLAVSRGTADTVRDDVTAWYGAIAVTAALLGWLLVTVLTRATARRLVHTRSAET